MTKTVSIASAMTAAVLLGIAPSSLTTTGLFAYAQEGFTVDAAIDSASLDKRTGKVTVDFTVTCSQPTEFSADASVSVSQTAGEKGHFGGKGVGGFEFITFDCNGETPLSVTVAPVSGFFTPGKAIVSVEATGCIVVSDELVCDGGTAEEQVHLNK